MHDMTAFEHQVAGEFVRRAGPVRPVDAAAILTAITATQSPKWRFQSMFNATKFVVAGAIVALFGGFLLSGVLTTQPSDEQTPAAMSPSPTTSQELLRGMITVEVEPGVFRVLDDGAGHDLVAEPPVDVTVAPDGSTWLLRTSEGSERGPWGVQADAVYRLGQEGTHPFEPARPSNEWGSAFAVDGSDVAWVSIGSDGGGTLASFDGSAWAAPTWPDGSAGVTGIEATDDGSVWLTQRVDDGPGPRVARVEAGEWNELPTPDDPALGGFFHGNDRYFAAAADGTAWLANGNFHGQDPGPVGLLHFDGDRWESVVLPGEGRYERAGLLALGSDGTLWAYLAEGVKPNIPGRPWVLARLDADGWTVFTRDDGVPQLTKVQSTEAHMAAGDGGRLWISPMGDGYFVLSNGQNEARHGDPDELVPPLGPSDVPHGVITFDGSTWTQFLRGVKVNRVDVAPDGTVYATALYGCPDGCHDEREDYDWSMAGLYVITPDAVAATE